MPLRPALLAAACATLALGGCFHTDAVLTVRADGSATLVETVAADGILGLGASSWAREAGPPHLDGARLTGLTRDERTGTLVTTTTWDIPDVSALRYDLRDAGGVAEMVRGLASWSRGQDEIPPHAPSVLRFGLDSVPGGAEPAVLRVTIPERTLRYADLARLPWHGSPLAKAFGLDGEITPEARAAMDAALAEMSPDERAAFDDQLSVLPVLQRAEAAVLGGTASLRFTVAVDGALVSTDGGRADGDRVVIADIDLAAVPEAPGDEAAFDAAARAGLDRPGLLVPAPGPIAVRFRP